MEEQTKTTQPEAASETAEKKPAEKTFTQKELDDIVKQRVDRAKKDMPDKQQLEEFRQWQNSRKSAEELSAEKVNAAENAKNEAERRLAVSEAKCAAFSKGVKPEAVDDVISLAMARVSNDVTVEKAIEAVIAKYPSFCISKPAEQAGITTGVSFGSGDSPAVSGVEAAFMKKNPGLKV